MPTQGRLTFQSGKPIMDADVTATSVYFTPYQGNKVPLWNGSAFVDTAFSEVSLSLASVLGGKLYDVFLDGNGLALGTAWASETARAVSISLVNGVWCDASHRTYLGTLYATANGQSKWQQKPTAVPYGSRNVLGLWNAYNRIRVHAICQDANTEWSYASNGIRYADNSENFRIYWVDGLAQSICEAEYQSSVAGSSTNPAAATVGVGLDASYPVNWWGSLNQAALNHSALGMFVEGRDFTYPKLGLHYWQAMEQSTAVPILFYGNNFSALTVDVEM